MNIQWYLLVIILSFAAKMTNITIALFIFKVNRNISICFNNSKQIFLWELIFIIMNVPNPSAILKAWFSNRQPKKLLKEIYT